jgi:hypothetical protein
MTRGRNDIVLMRMTEGGGCGACGWDLSQSETGFAIELVVEALFDDPALLEPLLVRRCRACGATYDWDILIAGDDDDPDREWDEKVARQAELHTALDEMLRTPRLQPRDAAKRVRRRFGVEGICVDDSSAIAWPLRRLQT